MDSFFMCLNKLEITYLCLYAHHRQFFTKIVWLPFFIVNMYIRIDDLAVLSIGRFDVIYVPLLCTWDKLAPLAPVSLNAL